MPATRCRAAWPAPVLPPSPELLSARLSSSSFSIFSGPEDFTATVRLSLGFYSLVAHGSDGPRIAAGTRYRLPRSAQKHLRLEESARCLPGRSGSLVATQAGWAPGSTQS